MDNSSDNQVKTKWQQAVRGIVLACFLGLANMFNGCGPTVSNHDETVETEEPREVELRVLLIDQGARFGETMQRLWSAQGRGSLILTSISREEFLEKYSERPPADVLIYPQDMLGELIRRNAVSELPKHVTHAESLERLNILDWERRVSGTWGDRTMGFSLGSPQLVLLFRRDLFESMGEDPPETWSDYQRVAIKLKELNETQDMGESWVPVVESLHPKWASKTLLARAAGYVRHPSRYSDVFDFVTLAPTINQAPFLRALKELDLAVGASASRLQDVTPDEATSMIYDGHCAMAIGVIRPRESQEFGVTELSENVGIASLPSSSEVYSFSQEAWERRIDDQVAKITLLATDGSLASVVNLSRKSVGAQDFLVWLTGPKESGQVVSRNEHSAPFRDEHLARITVWCDPRMDDEAAESYRELLQEELRQSLWMSMPRIPGAEEYMEVLGDAVNRVLLGDTDTSSALDEAATKWQLISQRIGESEQRQAYEKSLLLK